MITLVPFSKEYLAGVLDVILPIQQAEFGIPVTLADQPDLLDIPRVYQRGNGDFWIALAGAEVVGTIGLLDLGDGLGALRKMFVKAPYRGRAAGVSQLLLDALLQGASSRGFRSIHLGTTAQFLAAHRFYERHGFVEEPQAELPAAFPIMAVDTKFYRMDLTKAASPG